MTGAPIGRRSFLTTSVIAAGGAVAVATFPSVAGAATTMALLKPKQEELPEVDAGSVMTAKSWNDLVRRVNELSRAQA